MSKAGAVVIITIVLAIAGGQAYSTWQDSQLIKACINQGKTPVIQYSNLKECN